MRIQTQEIWLHNPLKIFFNLLISVPGLHCCPGFSLVVASGHSLVAVHDFSLQGTGSRECRFQQS